MFKEKGKSALLAEIFEYAICIVGFFEVKEDCNQMFFFDECFPDYSFYTDYLVYGTFGSEACL